MSDGTSPTIGAGEFKAECLRLLDEVAASRRPLVITKRGRPVAKLVPMDDAPELFGALQGSVLGAGDIVSPIEETPWNAER